VVSLRTLNSLVVPRMLTAGSLVSSATAVRVAVGCFELWAKRTPPLTRLALNASLGGPGTAKAQAEFRDDVIALARESAELSSRELRRGLAELDSFTRPRQKPGARPHRPHRAKL
jgi:CBS-domain-containing membrane protein